MEIFTVCALTFMWAAGLATYQFVKRRQRDLERECDLRRMERLQAVDEMRCQKEMASKLQAHQETVWRYSTPEAFVNTSRPAGVSRPPGVLIPPAVGSNAVIPVAAPVSDAGVPPATQVQVSGQPINPKRKINLD